MEQSGDIAGRDEGVTPSRVAWRDRTWVRWLALICLVLIVVVSGAYWRLAQSRVYTDKAVIDAPRIELSTSQSGILKNIFVRVGDIVAPNTSVARVGDDIVRSDVGGVVVGVHNQIGKLFTPGMPIVTMIDPKEYRVKASIKEDKGFRDVRVGQKVQFTVDAFGSQTFDGVVDEIAKTSDESSVVFNISDKREEKDFTVTVKYDTKALPKLLNGMSAKVWIIK